MNLRVVCKSWGEIQKKGPGSVVLKKDNFETILLRFQFG